MQFDSTTLLLGLIFGSIGTGYFIYGKRQSKTVFRYTGIALMVYPYFVESPMLVLAIGVVLLFLPKFVDL